MLQWKPLHDQFCFIISFQFQCNFRALAAGLPMSISLQSFLQCLSHAVVACVISSRVFLAVKSSKCHSCSAACNDTIAAVHAVASAYMQLRQSPVRSCSAAAIPNFTVVLQVCLTVISLHKYILGLQHCPLAHSLLQTCAEVQLLRVLPVNSACEHDSQIE